MGIGNAYTGWRVAMLIDGLNIEIVGFDGAAPAPHPRSHQGLPAHPLSIDPGLGCDLDLVSDVLRL